MTVGTAKRRLLGLIPKTKVRSRILAIALIPSLVLVVSVTGVVSQLIWQARQDRALADLILRSAPYAVSFNEAILQERRLTMLRVAHRPFDETLLRTQRQRVDDSGQALMTTVASLSEVVPGTFEQFGREVGYDFRQLADLRLRAEADTATINDAYEVYTRLAGTGAAAIAIMASHAPDAGSAVAAANTASLFRAADAMSAAYALADTVTTEDGFDSGSLHEFIHQAGAYHTELDALAHGSDDTQLRGEISALTSTPAWLRLSVFENSLIDRAGSVPDQTGKNADTARTDRTTQPLANPTILQQDSGTAIDGLRKLWRSHYEGTQRRAADIARSTTNTAILVGGTALVVTLAAFLFTLWLANRLARRLNRLRAQTLSLAEDQLPEIMTRIRAGEHVDLESALPVLDLDHDEIGEVAKAFDTAQRAAVSAAVTEAKTREAVNAVFLNLAHRSQLMAHRQLEVLDSAEAQEENPVLMSLLFQLDHLATRERRNAENLIILGGERPGRQWRNPVPLLDIVRSAIAETHDYARIDATRLPDVRINGAVVADVIHLLAELLDNATSFSPPSSRVEASGNVVGRGAVVEIVDQGLGMPDDEMVRINKLLSDTPDFGLLQLSSDSRLGLIVVSALAFRNGIKVRLAESDYGGIKAVVLIPRTLLAVDDTLLTPSEIPNADQWRSPGSSAPSPQAVPSHKNSSADFTHSPTARPSTVPEPPQRAPLPVAHELPAISAALAGPPGRAEDGRPPLPRRQRQEHLSPQLANSTVTLEPHNSPAARIRTAEQARDLMSAIATGTVQGRRAGHDTTEYDREGTHDDAGFDRS
ncbi:nitrate- and nitrite sensing domain-containing protein [Nocardia sp. NPDC004123]